MAAATITPTLATVSTTEGDIGSAVPAGEERSVDVRIVNKTSKSTPASVYVDVLISDGTTSKFLCCDELLTPRTAVDVAIGMTIPAGWKFRARASAADSVDITITGTKRRV